MNFSLTFSDRAWIKQASTEDKAKASVIAAIYDAIRCDSEFRDASLAMFNEKRYDCLKRTINGLLENEAKRLLSDAVSFMSESADGAGLTSRLGALASAQSAGESSSSLGSALGMIGEDKLDLVACYREAYSRFEIETSLYMELMRRSSAIERLRISEA